nr:MAG: putative minor capsid protein [Cypovirus sp.]
MIMESDIVKIVSALGSTSAAVEIDDELLRQILAEQQRQREVNDRLNGARQINVLRDIATQQLQASYSNIQHFPQLAVYDVGELIDIQSSMISGWHPNIICISDTITPLQHLFGGNKIYKRTVSTNNSVGITNDIYEYTLEVKLLSDELDRVRVSSEIYIRKTLESDELSIYQAERVINNYDSLRYRLTIQFVEIEFQAIVRQTDYESSLDVKTYDTAILYDMHVSLDEIVINANVNEKTYITPRIINNPLYSIALHVDSITDINELSVISLTGISEPLFLISTPTFQLMRKDRMPQNISDEYDATLRHKLEQDDLIHGYRTQMAIYGGEYQEVIETVINDAEYSSDILSASTVENAAKISDIASRVALYKEMETIYQDRHYGALSLRGPFFDPANWYNYYIDPKDKNVGFYFSYLDGTYTVGTTRITISDRWAVPLDVKADETAYIKILEDGDTVVFALVEIVRTTMSENIIQPDSGVMNGNHFVRLNRATLLTFSEPLPGENSAFVTAINQSTIGYTGSSVTRHIPIPYYETEVTIILKDIIMCFKEAVSFPRYIDGRFDYSLNYDDQRITGSVSDGVSGEFTSIEFGKLFCLFFNVNRTISTSLTIEKNRRPRIDAPNNFVEVLKHRRWRGMEVETRADLMYAATGFDARMTTTGIDNVNNSEFTFIFTIKPTKQHYLHGYMLNENVQDTIADDVRWSDVTGSKAQVAWQRLTHVVVSVTGRVSASIPLPPVSLGMRRTADEFQTITETVLADLTERLDIFESRLDTVEQQLHALQKQFEQLIASMETTFWDMILSVVIDAAIGILIPGAAIALGLLAKVLKNAVGSAYRTTSIMLSSMAKGKLLKSNMRRDKFPIESLVEAQTFNDVILKSLGKDKSTMFNQHTRPIYRKDHTAQHIDRTDKLDLITEMITGGRMNIGSEWNDVEIQSMLHLRNLSNNDRMLPTLNTYYRPLQILPKPIAEVLHNTTTNTQNFRNKLRYDAINATTRKPSHSFATYTDYEFITPNTYRVKMTYFGIGEPNALGFPTGDKNAGIGGVHIGMDLFGVGANKTMILSPLNYTELGYTSQQVDNVFKTLFNRDRPNHMSHDNAWSMIHDGINTRILSSDMMHSTNVPDGAIGRVIRDMVDNPPNFNYNLLNRNCQDVTRDIILFATGRGMPTKWPLNARALYNQIRTRTFIQSIGETETLKSIIDKHIKLNDTFIYNARVRGVIRREIMETIVKEK